MDATAERASQRTFSRIVQKFSHHFRCSILENSQSIIVSWKLYMSFMSTNTLRSTLCFHRTSSKSLQNKLDFFDKFLARASNATFFGLVNTFSVRGERLLVILYRVDKFHLRTDVCVLDEHW